MGVGADLVELAGGEGLRGECDPIGDGADVDDGVLVERHGHEGQAGAGVDGRHGVFTIAGQGDHGVGEGAGLNLLVDGGGNQMGRYQTALIDLAAEAGGEGDEDGAESDAQSQLRRGTQAPEGLGVGRGCEQCVEKIGDEDGQHGGDGQEPARTPPGVGQAAEDGAEKEERGGGGQEQPEAPGAAGAGQMRMTEAALTPDEQSQSREGHATQTVAGELEVQFRPLVLEPAQQRERGEDLGLVLAPARVELVGAQQGVAGGALVGPEKDGDADQGAQRDEQTQGGPCAGAAIEEIGGG